MKTLLAAFGFLALATLMLPGLVKPPADAVAADRAQVAALAHALGTALLEYQGAYDEFPQGGHGEILKKLRGKNRQGTVFLECPRETLNDGGELLDPWGTPFQIGFDPAQTRPRIHSAGPNGKFEGDSAMQRMLSDDYRGWP